MKIRHSRFTIWQRVTDSLSIAMAAGTLIYAAVRYHALPDRIASHFDNAGNITDYQGKSMLFMLGFILLLMTGVLCLLARIPGLYKTINSPWTIPFGREGAAAVLVKNCVCECNAAMTFILAYCLVGSIAGKLYVLPVWIATALTGVSVAVMILRFYRLCKR